MKLAASFALAELATKEIPKKVMNYFQKAYKNDYKNGIFKGKNPLKPDYIIPKPLDPRVVSRVAKAVAKAAKETNAAKVS